MTGEGTAEREPHVQRESSGIGTALSELAGNIDELENRLCPVLIDPVPSTDEAKEQEALVPLAEDLRAHKDRIYRLNDKINDIRNRIEL
ncbi:hypothetical protein LCGC14_2869620 [marine sediment metagenome]|uniref:Uncharacterized protein n=1 Tax=marine sediment metagenome TaxID=412755 RepID=A0A0F8Y378_9ZZZZ|nr:hypothetical protein [Desulfobacterales bacterium]